MFGSLLKVVEFSSGSGVFEIVKFDLEKELPEEERVDEQVVPDWY